MLSPQGQSPRAYQQIHWCELYMEDRSCFGLKGSQQWQSAGGVLAAQLLRVLTLGAPQLQSVVSTACKSTTHA